jgi:uncharacterized phage infection (PIP) family protein YhgE
MSLERAIEYAKLSVLTALVFLCVAVGVIGLRLVDDVEATLVGVRTDIHSATQQINVVSTELTRDADRLTTRADRLMIAAGATASEAHKAAEYQRLFWEKQTPQLVSRANKILDNTDRLLDNGNRLVVTADVATLALRDTLLSTQKGVIEATNQITQTGEETRKTLQLFPDIYNSPDIQAIQMNLAKVSTDTAQMTADAAYKFHQYAHPEQLHGKAKVWYYFKTGFGLFMDVATLRAIWP